MDRTPRHVAIFDKVDAQIFTREVRPLNRPAVLRGLVRDWPIAAHAAEGPAAIAGYLSGLSNGRDAWSWSADRRSAAPFSIMTP